MRTKYYLEIDDTIRLDGKISDVETISFQITTRIQNAFVLLQNGKRKGIFQVTFVQGVNAGTNFREN